MQCIIIKYKTYSNMWNPQGSVYIKGKANKYTNVGLSLSSPDNVENQMGPSRTYLSRVLRLDYGVYVFILFVNIAVRSFNRCRRSITTFKQLRSRYLEVTCIIIHL